MSSKTVGTTGGKVGRDSRRRLTTVHCTGLLAQKPGESSSTMRSTVVPWYVSLSRPAARMASGCSLRLARRSRFGLETRQVTRPQRGPRFASWSAASEIRDLPARIQRSSSAKTEHGGVGRHGAPLRRSQPSSTGRPIATSICLAGNVPMPSDAPRSKSDGRIFLGSAKPHDGIRKLPAPPPWRDFGHGARAQKGRTYHAGAREIELVNAALYLRRPLLITGRPGGGSKTSARACRRLRNSSLAEFMIYLAHQHPLDAAAWPLRLRCHRLACVALR